MSSYDEIDQKHEVENMRNYLQNDIKRDVSILIPASIIVFDQNGAKVDVEFDGIIIHPYRNTQQVIFLEAKLSRAAGHAESDLKMKLDKLNIPNAIEDIQRINSDAYFLYSII